MSFLGARGCRYFANLANQFIFLSAHFSEFRKQLSFKFAIESRESQHVSKRSFENLYLRATYSFPPAVPKSAKYRVDDRTYKF
jgi:methylmalonyl-CoA mutase N-terminal domain/subunit